MSNKLLSAVVKANAYGHGVKEIAYVINDYVDYFQVDDYTEFTEIKEVANKSILVTGYLSCKEMRNVIISGGIPCVNSIEQLKKVQLLSDEIKKPVKIHIKIDCFIGRQGILPSQITTVSTILRRSKYLYLAGVFTHYADVNNMEHVNKQTNCLKNCINKLNEHGLNGFLSHINSTSGILLKSDVPLNTYINRVGIGMYGLWHSKNIKRNFSEMLTLKPVLSWNTLVSQVKYLPKDHPVGYRLTYKTRRKTKVAVIPVGYSDGFDRRLSNKGRVIIKGEYCPVVGLVSMNMFVVDVGRVHKVNEGDKVTIIGKNGDKSITADNIADTINTINYEVLSRISPKIPRIVV